MKRLTFIATLAAVLGLGLGVTPALAQQKSVIKIGWTTSDSPGDPYASGAHAFKRAVEANSKGSIEVQLFPNRQLGDEKPMLEGLRFGTVDAAIITNAVVAQIEPAFQLNDLPFLYASEAQAHRVLDGKIGQELAKRLEGKGILMLASMEGGFRNMINNKKPVTTPGDVTGVKYRVMQNPVFIDMFNSMGGSAVPMAWGETFTAVQQGTIDGLEIPLAVIDASKYFEVTKFLSLTNHTYSAIHLLVSKRSFEKLNADQRKAVLEAARQSLSEQRKSSADNARQLVATLQSKGMKVNTIGDPTAFRKAVAPVYEKFRTSIGADLLNATLDEVK
jgi:TRAP-type transport system periplasmic protein